MRWPWTLLHRGRLEKLEEHEADTEAANRRLERKLQEKNRVEQTINRQLEANHFLERIDRLFRGD